MGKSYERFEHNTLKARGTCPTGPCSRGCVLQPDLNPIEQCTGGVGAKRPLTTLCRLTGKRTLSRKSCVAVELSFWTGQ